MRVPARSRSCSCSPRIRPAAGAPRRSGAPGRRPGPTAPPIFASFVQPSTYRVRSSSAMPVVLLVPLAFRLDLSGARDGLALAAKLVEVVAARVVEPARHLALQPAVELRVGLNRHLCARANRAGSGRTRPVRGCRPRGSRPGGRRGACGRPRRRRRIVRIGHEQRQAEAVQQPLDRALPVALVLAHLDQLARERQRLLGEAAAPAHRRSRIASMRGGDVRAPPAQRRQLRARSASLLALRPQRHVDFDRRFCDLGRAARRAPRAPDPPRAIVEKASSCTPRPADPAARPAHSYAPRACCARSCSRAVARSPP